jgi:NADP-dependent 3-hydroxy acid dehydrogenase YdfG
MNRIVVATGARMSVGRASSTEFARNGSNVALLRRDEQWLEQAALKLRQFGVLALPIFRSSPTLENRSD